MILPKKPGNLWPLVKRTRKASGLSGNARIILTRQEQRNKGWHQSLVEAGFQVLDLPMVRFAPLDVPAEYFNNSYDWILFTSPQGVDAFVASEMKIQAAKLGALGAGTSAALSKAGLPDDLGFNGSDGAEFARAFVDQISAPATVLLPGAAKRLEDPRATLAAAGFQVRELPLYETRPVPADELAFEFHSNDTIFFCSPSAVRAFIAAFAERPGCVAIGETTAAVCRENDFPTQVAETPNLNAMVRAAGCGPLTITPENES